MFKLGSKVRDKVSGFEGIAISETRFLNGCIRISVQAPLDKDGKFQDDMWFDIQQIETIGPGILTEPKLESQKPIVDIQPTDSDSFTGGPQDSKTPLGMKA